MKRIVREPALSVALVAMLLGGLAFWTALTLGFDGIVGRDIVRQIRAQDYPHVAGRLITSDVLCCEDDSAEAPFWSYEADVEYSYIVNGIDYRGTRLRYSGQTGTRRFSEAAVQSLLPKGPEVAVYYNPDSPADAILSPGVHGPDLFSALFLVPFNAIVALGMAACVRLRRYSTTGGAAVRDDGRIVRAGVRRWSPGMAAIAAAGATAFVLIFAIGVPSGGNPSLRVASGGWLLVLCAGGLAWGASVRVLATGSHDLVIDRYQQTLTLPVTCGRKERLSLPWAAISDIHVEDAQNDSETAHFVAVVIVTHDDGTTTHEPLSDPQPGSNANSLAAWIRGQIPPHREC